MFAHWKNPSRVRPRVDSTAINQTLTFGWSSPWWSSSWHWKKNKNKNKNGAINLSVNPVRSMTVWNQGWGISQVKHLTYYSISFWHLSLSRRFVGLPPRGVLFTLIGVTTAWLGGMTLWNFRVHLQWDQNNKSRKSTCAIEGGGAIHHRKTLSIPLWQLYCLCDLCVCVDVKYVAAGCKSRWTWLKSNNTTYVSNPLILWAEF